MKKQSDSQLRESTDDRRSVGRSGLGKALLVVGIVLLWVTIFLVVTFLGFLLFPYESVCNPAGTSLTDDLNCRLGWALLSLVVAAGVATGVVIVYVRMDDRP
jgi:hypothetical protein